MIAKNLSVALIAQIGVTLLGLFLTYFCIDKFGIDDYGLIVIGILLSYRGAFPILFFGTFEYLIYHDAASSLSIARSVLRIGFLYLNALSLIMFLALFLAGYSIIEILMFYFSILIQSFLLVVRARLAANNMISLQKMTDFVSLFLFVMFVLNSETISINWILLFLTISAMFELITIFLVIQKKDIVIFPKNKFSCNISFTEWSQFAIRSLFSASSSHGDKLIVSGLLGVQAYGIYDAILKIPRLLKTSGGLAQYVLTPWFRSFSKDSAILSNKGSRSLLISRFVFVLLYLGAYLGQSFIPDSFLSGVFLDYQLEYTLALTWMYFSVSINIPYAYVLSTGNHSQDLTNITVFFSVIRLVTSLVLAYIWSMLGLIVGGFFVSFVVLVLFQIKFKKLIFTGQYSLYGNLIYLIPLFLCGNEIFKALGQ